MRTFPFLFSVFCVLISPFHASQAFEGVRTPVIVGLQTDGIEPYDALVRHMETELSNVFRDRAFLFKQVEVKDLSDSAQTSEIDYLFSSASVFAALQHYAGFSPIASTVPKAAAGPNHASALTIIVRRADKHLKTVGDLKNAAIGIRLGSAPDVTVQLKQELKLRGINPGGEFKMTPVDESGLDELLVHFAEHRIPVDALGLIASPHLDATTLAKYNLRVLEPRLNDDLSIAHTTSTYPGWVLSANFKVDRETTQRIGAFLRTLKPVDGWFWTTPADFRSLHAILERSDPFYGGFEPKSIWDYVREYQSWVWTAVLFLLGVFIHIARTGSLLRKRTQALNAANAERLESERRYHLLERQNIVGQLSSVVAHEIRQPLAAVSNYAMALRRRHVNDDLDDAALAYGLERLVIESGRANEIVDYVQKYVRASEKNKVWLDISSLLTEMAESYADSTGETFVDLRINRGIRYYMDVMDLNLMVRNLIKNALEATRGLTSAKGEQIPKTILACGETPDGGVTINVSDAGPALSDEAFHKLQQPLNSTKSDGLGLGLSIVRLIAESYGGHVEFSRLTPSGLSVTIVLPKPMMTNSELL